MNPARFAVSVIIFSILGGCASTLDLASDPTALSERNRAVAKKMAEMVQSVCKKSSYDRVTGEQKSGNVKMGSAATVKKLYSSNKNGWFKADIVSEGVWDSVFYNQTTEAFVCGEKSWATRPELRTVVFDEIQRGS